MASEQTKEYTLRTGSHTWIDGKTYTANDPDNNKMTLTKEQMERIGKERFEGQTSEATQTTISNLTSEIARLKGQLAQLNSQVGQAGQESRGEKDNETPTDYSDILSKSIPDITSYLQSVNDVSVLSSIQTEESKGGQPRVGVLKAINQRREELSNQS